MSSDAHLRFEVPGACRLLRFALEAFIFVLGRSGLFYSDGHVGAELLQLERVVSGYVAVRGLRARPAWAGRLEVVSPALAACRARRSWPACVCLNWPGRIPGRGPPARVRSHL